MAYIYVDSDGETIEIVRQNINQIYTEYIRSSEDDYVCKLPFDVIIAQSLIDKYGHCEPMVCTWNNNVFLVDLDQGTIYGTAPYIDEQKLIQIVRFLHSR